MVDLVYCLISLLFFYIPLLYRDISITIINNFLSFFWKYISFFRYLFNILICNCLWIILSWIFRNFWDFLIFHYYVYYYVNLSSSIISCLFSGDIFLSLDISLSCSFITISMVLLWNFWNASNFNTNKITSRCCCFSIYWFWTSF